MRIHTIGMIASRMVGCGLMLIGLIVVVPKLFIHHPIPESQRMTIEPPTGEQPVQVRYFTTCLLYTSPSPRDRG